MAEKILLDYVEQVYTLESEHYTLEKIIEKLQTIQERSKKELERTNNEYIFLSRQYNEISYNEDGKTEKVVIYLGIFFIIIGWLAEDKFIATVWYLLALAILALGICSYKNMKEEAGELKYEMDIQMSKMEAVNRECAKIKKKIFELQAEINDLERLKLEKNKVLNQLYEVNIIHKTYRNFYGISKIYHVLDTGICDTLTGINGAYSQIRMDQIIDNQRISIELQKELLTTNQMMYVAINRTNSLLDGISTKISELSNNNRSLIDVLKNNLEVSNFLEQSSKNDMAAIRSATEYIAYAEHQRRIADGKFY